MASPCPSGRLRVPGIHRGLGRRCRSTQRDNRGRCRCRWRWRLWCRWWAYCSRTSSSGLGRRRRRSCRPSRRFCSSPVTGRWWFLGPSAVTLNTQVWTHRRPWWPCSRSSTATASAHLRRILEVAAAAPTEDPASSGERTKESPLPSESRKRPLFHQGMGDGELSRQSWNVEVEQSGRDCGEQTVSGRRM